MVVIERTSKLCPKISIPISFEKDILAWWECLVGNDKCPKSKTVGLAEYRQPCDRDGIWMKGFALSSWGNAAITYLSQASEQLIQARLFGSARFRQQN